MRLRFVQNYIIRAVRTSSIGGNLEVALIEIPVKLGKIITVDNIMGNSLIIDADTVANDIPNGVFEIVGTPIYAPPTPCCKH